MTNIHWAIMALRDINEALDQDRYDVASHHIDDAIFAIIARDAQDGVGADYETRKGRVQS